MHRWSVWPFVICCTSLTRIDYTILRSLTPDRISRHCCSCCFGVWNSIEPCRWTFMRPRFSGVPFLAALPPYRTLVAKGNMSLSPLLFLAWMRSRMYSMISGLRPLLSQRWRQRRAWDLRSNPAMNFTAGTFRPQLYKLRWFSFGLYLTKSLKHNITSLLKGESAISV